MNAGSAARTVLPDGQEPSVPTSVRALVVAGPVVFPMRVEWDPYPTEVAPDLFVQGSKDKINWVNKAEVSPAWASNSVSFIETDPQYFYRLMVQ